MTHEVRIPYGSRSEERKRLVKAISEYMETFSEYAGPPTFAYRVDGITIDRDGVVVIPGGTAQDDVDGLIEYLSSKGFDPVPGSQGQDEPEPQASGASEHAAAETSTESTPESDAETEAAGPADSEDSASDLSDGDHAEGTLRVAAVEEEEPLLTLELPREGFTQEALENLRKIIDSKATLLKKSIGAEDHPLEITEDRIRFPWFHTEDPMEIQTYTKLVSAMGKMAREARRVVGKDHPVESEKYAFRIWLLRLGFGGAECKNDRAILMRNLSGHAAFKNQADAQTFYQKLRERRVSQTRAAVAEASDTQKEAREA